MQTKHDVIEISCVNCGSWQYQPLFKAKCRRGQETLTETRHYTIKTGKFGHQSQIVKCLECGMVYTNPRLSQTSINHIYSLMVDESYLQEQRERTLTFSLALDEIFRRHGQGVLLDVGCATGLLLAHARERGWCAVGIEPSWWGVTYAKNQFGLNVVQGSIEIACFSSASFDLITCLDVIEHLFVPSQALAEAYRILKPGGRLFLTTPNIGSFLATLLRARWYGILNEHLNYYSPNTIRYSLARVGFQDIEIKRYGRVFCVGYWVNRLLTWNFFLGFLVSLTVKSLGIQHRPLYINLGDQMSVLASKPSQTTPDLSSGND